MQAVAEATIENPIVRLKAIMAIANRFHVGITEERLTNLQHEAMVFKYLQTHSGVKPDEVTMEQAAQVDEVVVVMRGNLEKVLERDVQLGDLEDKSGNLADSAFNFQSSSTKLKKQM